MERLQDAEVALILDVPARVARGPVEVDDAGIQGMRRIEFAEHRAVQPLISPRGAKFCAAEHGHFPLAPITTAAVFSIRPDSRRLVGAAKECAGHYQLRRPWYACCMGGAAARDGRSFARLLRCPAPTERAAKRCPRSAKLTMPCGRKRPGFRAMSREFSISRRSGTSPSYGGRSVSAGVIRFRQ